MKNGELKSRMKTAQQESLQKKSQPEPQKNETAIVETRFIASLTSATTEK